MATSPPDQSSGSGAVSPTAIAMSPVAATASEPSVQTITLSNGPVEVLDLPAADGAEQLAPLVFLHEGLGSLKLWRSFPHEVHAATGRRTVVWSRHGYGNSVVVTASRDVAYMHHEGHSVLPELLATLGLRPAILVGHSDGGSIALLTAGSSSSRDNETIVGLVLLAAHVIVEDETIAGIEAARDAANETELLVKLRRHHTDVAATFWGWNDIWLDPDFRAWDITDHLAAIGVPVLAIQGHDDQYGTMRQLDLIQQLVAGSVTRVELDDCGHSPHLDRPDAVLTAVVDFLSDLP